MTLSAKEKKMLVDLLLFPFPLSILIVVCNYFMLVLTISDTTFSEKMLWSIKRKQGRCR